MIQLTRIDGTTFYLNPDLIEIVEATHDTYITLTNGAPVPVRGFS